jgi:hypothetical protein
MKDYEDEAFDELEKKLQKQVATGVTDDSKFVQPKAVGNWVLYANAPQTLKFRMYAKPTDEQIKNTEALLGWKWEDI